MKRVFGATAALLIMVGAAVPAGQSLSATGAGSRDWSGGQVTAGSWDWPK